MGGSATGSQQTSNTNSTTTTSIPNEIRRRGTRITNAAMRTYFDPAQKYTDFTYDGNDQALGAARTAQLNQHHAQGAAASNAAQTNYQPYYSQAGTAANNAASNTVSGPNYNWGTISQFMSPYTEGVIDTGVRRIGEAMNQQRLADQSRAAQAGAFGSARHGVVDSLNAQNAMTSLSDFVGGQLQQGFQQAVGQYNTDFDQNLRASGQNYAQGMGHAQFLQGLGSEQQAAAIRAQQSANNQGNLTMAQDQAQRDAALAARDQRMNYPMDVYERLAGMNAMQPVPRTSTTSGTTTQQTQGGWLGPVLNAAGTVGGTFFSDERLKEDVKNTDPEAVLGAFSEITPKTYAYTREAREAYPDMTRPGVRTGFLAQDVERAFGTRNPRTREGYQAVDIPEMIGRLVTAVHGLEKRTRKLKSGS